MRDGIQPPFDTPRRFIDAGSGVLHISDGGATINFRGTQYEDTLCGRRLKVRVPVAFSLSRLPEHYRRDLCSKCQRKATTK